MNKTTSAKALEKFKKEYEKLLAKHPQVQVWPNRDGDLYASIDMKYRTYLPSCAPRTDDAR
jgi:hypothetical protein